MSGTRLGFPKLLPLGTLLALILPLLLVFTAPVSAATLCVRPGGGGGCYATIQAAVIFAAGGDTIEVRTGSYIESVDLALAAGDITIVAVDGPGTVTVKGGGNPAFHTSVAHTGDVTIDGFIVESTGDSGISVQVSSDVVIRNVTANGTVYIGIEVAGASGNVTISDCTANNNYSSGIKAAQVSGNVTIDGCTADNNGGSAGIYVSAVGGDVKIVGCTASHSGLSGIGVWDTNGDVIIRDSESNNNEIDGFIVTRTNGTVTITNCTANDNGRQPLPDGFDVGFAHGDVIITNCTANQNDRYGFIVHHANGNVTIAASRAWDNWIGGVALFHLSGGGTYLVNGSIICGNDQYGARLDPGAVTVDATGNWWGCPDGPGNPGCDPVDPGAGTVNFDPWIDTVTASAPASAMAGDPTMVSFQFSDSAQTVFLGEGPGDLHGDPTFIVTTDNGTITEGGFVNAPDGVMEVTLVPDHTGTATVWADGPCGLDAAALMAAWEFVPEPGTILLLGSGLLGLAGYATVRLRSGQALRWRARE